MDGQKFDQITKALAEGATRRRFIKGIAGGAVGALAGVFGAKRAETVLAQTGPLCPGGGGPNNKICHCPPGQNGGNCQTTGNGGDRRGGARVRLLLPLGWRVQSPLRMPQWDIRLLQAGRNKLAKVTRIAV